MSYNPSRNHPNCDPAFQCKNKRGFGMGKLYCIEEHAKFHLYAKDKIGGNHSQMTPMAEARSDQTIMPL